MKLSRKWEPVLERVGEWSVYGALVAVGALALAAVALVIVWVWASP